MTDDRITFSVIVPTRGRRSLRGTLASVAEQIEPGDEILVRCSQDGDFGNSARQSLLERARGTHIVFIDDDDQLARGALAAMREFARTHPHRIGIFRMRLLDGRIYWKTPEMLRTNVGTPMFCVPNVEGRLGSWTGGEPLVSPSGRHYDVADFEFISQTVALQGDPIFCESITAHIRADRRRSIRLAQRLAAPLRRARHRVSRGSAR